MEPYPGPSSSNAMPYMANPSNYPNQQMLPQQQMPIEPIYQDMPSSSNYWPAPGGSVDPYYSGYANMENTDYYGTTPMTTMMPKQQLHQHGQPYSHSQNMPLVPIPEDYGYQNQQMLPPQYPAPTSWQDYSVPSGSTAPSLNPNPVQYPAYQNIPVNQPIDVNKACYYEQPYPSIPPSTASYSPRTLMPPPPLPSQSNASHHYNTMPLTSDNIQNTTASNRKPNEWAPGPSSSKARTVKPPTTSSDGAGSGDEPRDITRRLTNNTRERIRVRDINTNFKELNEMIAIYHPTARGNKQLTKLGILTATTELITHLQNEVEKRNLKHKLKFKQPK